MDVRSCFTGRRSLIAGCALLASAAAATVGVAGASPRVSAATAKSCGKVTQRGGGAQTKITILKGSVTCSKAKSTILFVLNQTAGSTQQPHGWHCTQGAVTGGYLVTCKKPGTVVTGRQKF